MRRGRNIMKSFLKTSVILLFALALSSVMTGCAGCGNDTTNKDKNDMVETPADTSEGIAEHSTTSPTESSSHTTSGNYIIDEFGNRYDENGNRVDENGNFIDNNGNLIDENANRTDENGNILDDAGNIVNDAGNAVGNVIDDVGNAVKDVADGVGNGVRNMTR